MAFYPAIGTSPVSFLDGNEEQQELPLSAIYIGPSGADARSWPLYTANQPVVDALLALMISAGYLAPGTNTFSITATAAQAGPMGNFISVSFSNPQAPSVGTMDVTVTATETYSGLTPATILTTLGTTGATASGLVYVEPGSGAMPIATTEPSLPGSGLAVQDVNGGTAFTLVATNTTDAADAALISVVVTPIRPPATSPPSTSPPITSPPSTSTPTFNLTVSWTKSTTSPVSLASLLSSNPFTYVITLPSTLAAGSLPPAGLPRAGSVTLSGGAAATASQTAVAATANILAATP
jgi:hypothetical protein